MVRSLACLLAASLLACGSAAATPDAPPAPDAITPHAAFDRMPSGVAEVDGRVFLSFPRWVEDGAFTVAELVDGELVPYPSAAANDMAQGAAALHSVNGIHADEHGRLWILDNGRVDLGPAAADVPKVVVWDTRAEREAFRYVFPADVAPPAASFLNDIAVSVDQGVAYISQSGMGGPPSLIVWDWARDRSWRALDGAPQVSADPDVDIVIDGETVMLHRPDGAAPWRVAVNGIALTPDGEMLYFGAMSSRTLYGIPTDVLRQPDLDDAARIEQIVAPISPRPLSDGIAVDDEGLVWMTDVEHAAIVVDDGSHQTTVVRDPRMAFPVAIEPGDGGVWVTSNQLHLMPLLRAGDDGREPPYWLWWIPDSP